MGGGISSPFFSARGAVRCKDLVIKTQLFSPDKSVLQDLSEGDKLDIELLGDKGPCIAKYKDKIAGTIISKELLTLIECISKGNIFVAIVRRISGGECAITIICQP